MVDTVSCSSNFFPPFFGDRTLNLIIQNVHFSGVQWLRLHPANAGDVGLISGRGTKIPHTCVARPKKKKTSAAKMITSTRLTWNSLPELYSRPVENEIRLGKLCETTHVTAQARHC